MKKIRFKQTEIGMIPEDWEVKKVEDLFQIFAGGDLSKIDFSENKSKEYRYRVYSNSLKDKGLYGFSKNYQYEPECITITGRGDVGRAECRREPFNAIVRLLVLKPKKEVSCYFFASFINIKLDFSYIGSAVNQLTAPEISQRLIAFPSIEEQKRIAKILSDLDSKIEL
ncbi:MAG: restriction endonuclease subunit S, partial [Nanoarchaeota archaeon]